MEPIIAKTNTLFTDCDGVLADFDHLAEEIFGMHPRDFEKRYGEATFWRTLHEYGTFFLDLPLMSDAMDLWNNIKHLDPIILTGCPRGGWAEAQKVEWAKKQFGEDVKIITCMARNKVKHIEQPGDILVDDRTHYRHLWEQGGGHFIHHISTQNSLVTLEEMHPEWFK